MKDIKLKVNEIFYSIQGEGANTGMPAVFIRLSGCNLKCPFCDTHHKTFTGMSIKEIRNKIEEYNCKNIVWTGGEPTLQLTSRIVSKFKDYYQCIETNGTNEVPYDIDYVACSPKKDLEELEDIIGYVDEIRLPVKKGDIIPNIAYLPKVRNENYYLSPIDISQENIDYCLKLIKENPKWKLSVQMHKLLKIQ